ncbi:MAG: hypothetical protein AABZ31_12150 [Bdellovibrionota bacterium]
MKELNVIFQYNGHDFDAYEALGLPAGSSSENARIAFENAKNHADPGAREFLETAYQSIVKSRS